MCWGIVSPTAQKRLFLRICSCRSKSRPTTATRMLVLGQHVNPPIGTVALSINHYLTLVQRHFSVWNYQSMRGAK